jgi:hypothetical protein
MLAYFTVTVGYLANIMPHLITMEQPCRGTYVPGGHDAFVFHDYGAAFSSITGRPCSYSFTHV